MATIIYGVSGEGSGHSTRALVAGRHLVESGHRVKIVTYQRGIMNLQPHFDVFETEGLHIASVDNKVNVLKTIKENVKKLPHGTQRLKALRSEVFEAIEPDCVITDFEPMTAYLAAHYKLPCISLDNQHRMRYMEYPYPPNTSKDRLVTENVIRAMVPWPHVSLVVSFYAGKPKNDHTFIMPPILREDMYGMQARNDGHVLVYMTSVYDSLLELLKRFKRETFYVYGAKREGKDENVIYKPFSRDGFLDDLISCKAVMATAGFTLTSESLYLGKPYLAMPLRGQYEQMLNAYLLADVLGFGKNQVEPLTEQAIAEFLYRIPEYREALTGYEHQDNSKIKAKLDELLADDCKLLKEFHRKKLDS